MTFHIITFSLAEKNAVVEMMKATENVIYHGINELAVFFQLESSNTEGQAMYAGTTNNKKYGIEIIEPNRLSFFMDANKNRRHKPRLIQISIKYVSLKFINGVQIGKRTQ